jgi:predicted AlkP superfamily pyrophosphatase or phosphodiesterase
MRRILLLLTLVTATAVGLRAQQSPRLLVVLVVDQMRADYLTVFDRHWRGGFRTLLDQGVVFENARYPYMNTWTCAGHATISTGTLPRTHGMVANAWWDRETKRSVACTFDPAAPNISYGEPVPRSSPAGDDDDGPGNSPSRLRVPTLADELRAQQPGARVVTLSMKARSAIGLAGHAGDVVVWYDAGARSFVTSAAYTSAPVASVKAFMERYPIARDNGRPWSLLAPADSYLMRDAGVGERPPAGWTGLFPHVPMDRDGADGRFYTQWQYTPFADAYLGEMAAWLVDDFKLGQRDAADFLGISFSVLDTVGHEFGPESREVEDTLRRLDATLDALIDSLDAQVGRANYQLVLTADHGVPPIPMAPRSARVANEDVRDRIEETLTEAFGTRAEGPYVAALSSAEIIFAPGVFGQLTGAPAVRAAVAHAVEDIPGVERVLWADQLSEESPDRAIRSAALGHVDGRSGDLVLVPDEYWYFGRTTGGTTHGSYHDYDQHVPLIVFGGGVSPRHDASAVTPADIAPTLARFGGVRLSRAEGRTLVD